MSEQTPSARGGIWQHKLAVGVSVAVCVYVAVLLVRPYVHHSTAIEGHSVEKAAIHTPSNMQVAPIISNGQASIAHSGGLVKETSSSVVAGSCPTTEPGFSISEIASRVKGPIGGAEKEKAISLFADERAMWSKIKSVSARVEIGLANGSDSAKRVHGVLRLQQTDLKNGEDSSKWFTRRYPWSCELVITGDDPPWRFTSDGSREGTHLECQDTKLAEQLKDMLDQGTVQVLLLPKIVLLSAYDDGLFSRPHPGRKGESAESFARGVTVVANPQAENIADSYSFIAKTPENGMEFTGGHFSSWGKGMPGRRESCYSFEDYAASGHLWFPTHITVQQGRSEPKYEFRLADVQLNSP